MSAAEKLADLDAGWSRVEQAYADLRKVTPAGRLIDSLGGIGLSDNEQGVLAVVAECLPETVVADLADLIVRAREEAVR